jgi:alpha/beta superfamily hydrolase
MSTLKSFSVAGAAGFLDGIIHMPEGLPRAIAVIAHPLSTMGGTMENKVVTTLAKTFVELGFVALRFNFRGVGGSEGEFDEGVGEVEDVLAVVRYARQEFGDLPLILSGFSFGGYVQACAAHQLHPQQLVLVAPAVGRFAPSPTLITSDLAAVVGQPSRMAITNDLPVYGLSQMASSPISSSIRTGMPPVPQNTLLIHGEQDEVVPLADVLDWARPPQLPVVVLPGAEHFFHGRLGQIKEIVLKHFTGFPI